MMKPLTGRHVLIMLLSAFAVTAAVNGYFVYSALSTFNGREAGSAYEDGLHYNDRLKAAQEQTALGWAHKVELTDTHTVRVAFTDKAGAPVAGLKLKGEIGRPAVDRYTREITFTEAQPGVYTAATNELEAGGWIVAVTAAKSQDGADKPVYRLKERLGARPQKPVH